MKRTRRTTRNARTDRLAAVRKIGNAALASVEAARENATARMEEAGANAVRAVNKLERAFEARVARAMSKLGVPTSREVRALAREVATLKASVQRLARSRARA
jgi:poly(hydroxyalkanoate) granule-associated protein